MHVKDLFINYLSNIQQLTKVNRNHIEQLRKRMQQCFKTISN